MSDATPDDPPPGPPTIDLAALVHYDREVREGTARAILDGFGTYGLVYIEDHGVDLALRDRLFARFLELTDRPREDKEPLNRPDLWFQRGWTPPNTERAVAAGGQPDFKECYFAAPLPTDPEAQLEYPQLYADNVWPEGKDGVELREDTLTLGRQLHEAGLALLSGVALGLGLHERWFDNRLGGAAHVLRLLRYLPLSEAQLSEDVLWGEEHTDFNLLTLLAGGCFFDPDGGAAPSPDPESGLFLRTREGERVRGQAPEGCLVAQVGQQLEILTGGALVATPHVITPPRVAGWTRVAGAHFLHLHAHQMLRPLPSHRSEEAVKAYAPPVLAGTYALKTLVDIGLAPPEALEGLGYRAPGG
jgi:isopenicillin N synthase-like dioxygenase